MLIDYDELEEIAKKGVRRAVIFMGLGINAAQDDNFNKYELTDITQIQIVGSNANAKTIRHYKEEFSNWIIACGLRELIETFSIFLDRTYNACLLIKINKGLCNKEKFPQLSKKFHRKGFPDKLEVLRREFDIFSISEKEIISVNEARNCLTHRQGIIGKEDLNFNNRFQIKWKGIDVFIKTPFGEIIPVNPMPENGIFLKTGGTMNVGFVERSLLFEFGKSVILSSKDLSEICVMMLQSIKEIKKTSFGFSQKMGIPFKKK